MSLTVFVEGTPRPQGSKRYLGRGRLVEANGHVYQWRETIAQQVRAAAAEQHVTFEAGTPVQVRLNFYFTRPKSHLNKTGLTKRAPVAHTRTPDVDKLVRAVGDALTMSGVWQDDAQVTEIHATKQWSTELEGVFIDLTPSPSETER